MPIIWIYWLYFLPTGEIAYFIAAVVVLYNVDDQIQRHYTGHTSDIRCLTIHPNKLIIATGQNASNESSSRFEKRPHVRVWDSVSLNTLHILGLNGEFNGIACLAFSKLDGGIDIVKSNWKDIVKNVFQATCSALSTNLTTMWCHFGSGKKALMATDCLNRNRPVILFLP